MAVHYLHTVHLTTTKTNMISTEMKPNEKIMYRPKKAHYRNIQQQEKGNVTSKKEIKYLRKTRTLPHIQTRI